MGIDERSYSPEYEVDRWVATAKSIASFVAVAVSILLRVYGQIDEAARATENILQMNWLSPKEQEQLLVASSLLFVSR